MGETLRLEGEEFRHARARRVSPGDPLVLLDGSGREGLARAVEVKRGFLRARLDEIRQAAGEPPVELLLEVGSIRPARLAWLVEKATELGATRIVPVAARRAQRERIASSRAESARLQRIAREAAKQCGRARWPEVAMPASFSSAVRSASGARLILDPGGDPMPECRGRQPIALLVGPEGGWSGEEITEARACGWRAVRLPFSTLRTETAALAALSLVRILMERSE